jgi:hypothetical protein
MMAQRSSKLRLEFPSRRIVMMRRAIPVFAALIALSQPASAGVPLFGHVSCAVVRFYVAKYSEAAAEKWARSHGASESEIETARHCLHGSTDVQTASLAAKPQVVAASLTGHEGSQHKPDERELGQAVLHAAVEAQRAVREQDSHDEQSAVHDVIRPKDIEDRSAGRESNEVKDQPVPTDGKASTSRPRNLGGTHRAYNSGATGWFKRLWARLTRGPQLTLAVLHLNGGARR